jgi:hypothetical protein
MDVAERNPSEKVEIYYGAIERGMVFEQFRTRAGYYP